MTVIVVSVVTHAVAVCLGFWVGFYEGRRR